MTRDVVVTGLGMVTPCGSCVEETWGALVTGHSGVARLTRFPLWGASTVVAGVVPGFESVDSSEPLAREFALLALSEALAQAELPEDIRPGLAVVANHGERRAPAEDCDAVLLGVTELAEVVRDVCGAERAGALYGACAAGGMSICVGADYIRTGQGDVAIVGGVDALLNDFDFFQFCNLYAMTTRDCPPSEASCPFDARRDGFVLSEGAAFLVLESADFARRRGAEPLARVAGHGMSQNAYHMVASPPDAVGPTQAMAAAIDDARVDASEIGYLNAHGTSTRDNDWCETMATRKSFGAAADGLAVSSTKSQMGHPMGAAGAIEAIVCITSLREGVVPPTINYSEPDPRCDLDYVPNEPREASLRYAMTNSFGFGGHNTSIIFGRP